MFGSLRIDSRGFPMDEPGRQVITQPHTRRLFSSILPVQERMKEKILFVSRKWPPSVGGMENYAAELAAGLSESSDIRTLVLKGRHDGRPPALLAYAFFVLRAMLYCLLHAREYDRVIFGDLILFPAALCHRLINRKAKRLVILYGLDLVYHRRKGVLPLLYGIFFALFRASQSCFSSAVAISRYTAGLALDERIKNVTVINPSLPRTSFPAQDVSRERLPESWNRKEGTFRLLYFGRLVPRKGSLWFASLVVPRLRETVSFFVAGDSSDSGYKQALARCQKTYCLGRIDSASLATMIRAADAVVMPNVATPDSVDAEGFGLVAIEASALGSRLLASRLDGITDAVIDGVTGTLVEPGDKEAWISAIERLYDAGAHGTLPSRESVARATHERFSRSAQAASFLKLLGIDPLTSCQRT